MLTAPPRKTLTPATLGDAVALSDPVWLPDGRIAVVTSRADMEANDYRGRIVAVADEPFELTGGWRDTMPRVSPDGRWLAYLSVRATATGGPPSPDTTPQVFVLPLDGGAARALTELPEGATEIVWLPDSSGVLVAARLPDGATEGLSPRDRPARRITGRWKLDTMGVTVDRRRHVCLLPVDGGDFRQITRGPFDDAMVAVSPNGDLCAFVSSRAEGAAAPNGISDVYVVPVASDRATEPILLTTADGAAANPVFVDAGEAIVYFGHRRATQGSTISVPLRVNVPPTGAPPSAVESALRSSAPGIAAGVGVDTGPGLAGPRTPVRLVPDLDRNTVPFPPAGPRPALLPDGTHVLVPLVSEGRIHAATVPARGGALRPVAAPDGVITGASASPDGSVLALTVSYPDRPGVLERCTIDPTGGEMTELWDTAGGNRYLDVRELRTRSGVHGYVTAPPEAPPASSEPETRSIPVLLDIHGGPFAQYTLGFFDEFQIPAAAGFVVVACNPRGSDGYGQEWADAIHGDWGNHDAIDILEFLDAAIAETPGADPNRVVVMGGSYGGYMTSWLIGHTDRFVAACSERAVNDLHAIWGQSDIAGWFVERAFGVTVTDHDGLDVDLLRERSPITYATAMTTPLLILHAEGDLRCPVAQAEALHTALTRLGREVEFLLWPGESHELSRSGTPKHREERWRHILGFFGDRVG